MINVDPKRIRALSAKAIKGMRGATVQEHVLVSANIIMTYCEATQQADLLIKIGQEISQTGRRMARQSN